MSNRSDFDPLKNHSEMAALISQVTAEPIERVVERLEQERRRPGSSVRADFERTGGQMYEWGPQLEAFYSSTDAFIYELAVWNRNPLKIGMRKWVGRDIGRAGKPLDVLGIGDGLGFDCLHLARQGHRVTYFELPGLSEQFARKLFEQTEGGINVITDPATIPVGAFDAITCLDVLEHVPDPPAMVATLASYLRPGGRLYASAPFYLVLPWYPTHLRSNRRFSGSLRMYRKAGLRLEGGRFGWNPVVLRKPESASDQSPEPLALAARLSAPMLRAGRSASWPFVPLHFLRRVFSRPFENE